jgi:hypothetical protein
MDYGDMDFDYDHDIEYAAWDVEGWAEAEVEACHLSWW